MKLLIGREKEVVSWRSEGEAIEAVQMQCQVKNQFLHQTCSLDLSRRRGKIINPLFPFAIKPDFDTRPRPGSNHLSPFTMLYTQDYMERPGDN